MPEVLIEKSFTEEGREAYESGKPCEPPEDLHMLEEMSWASGWLQARGEDPSNDYDTLTPDD